MPSILKIALRHPYTFVVMAVLILIFGAHAILTTPSRGALIGTADPFHMAAD